MRLFLVEDDQNIADFIVKGFTEAGFVVDHAARVRFRVIIISYFRKLKIKQFSA